MKIIRALLTHNFTQFSQVANTGNPCTRRWSSRVPVCVSPHKLGQNPNRHPSRCRADDSDDDDDFCMQFLINVNRF